jgi:hypothetical protein
VLSPATGFLATVAPEKLASQELDASIGASGPHDFAVRKKAPSSLAPLASTASRPASVTIANRPSVGRDGGHIQLIWVRPQAKFRKIRIRCRPPRDDALPLARQVMLLMDGSFAVTLLHRDPTYMETVGEATCSLVKAALASR